MVSREQDLEVDIEAGRSNVTQESTSDVVSAKSRTIADDLIYPLMGDDNPADKSIPSSHLSQKKCDNVKFNKSRKASKPPRPPKGPSLSLNDHKVMMELAELAVKKRARIERMKNCLRRIKAAKSSSSTSPCLCLLSTIVTLLFFIFMVFQGLFTSSSSLNSDKSPAPTFSPSQLISVQFYNEFAPVEQTDPSPTTSFGYTRKRYSGAEEEESSRDVTR